MILSLATCLLAQTSEYNPFPNQTPDNYSLGVDREKLPFRDDIGNPYGAFVVTPIEPENEAGKAAANSDVDNEALAENFYTILVPGNDRIVIFDLNA